MSIIPVTIGCISAYSHNHDDDAPIRSVFNLIASIATGVTVAFMAHNGLEASEISNYFTNIARDAIGGFIGYTTLRTVNTISNTPKPQPPV